MSVSTAISASAVARVLGIKTEFKNFGTSRLSILPQRLAVVGQGNTATVYDTTKKQINNALEVGQTYGFGSPLHLAALQLMPSNGDGVANIPVTFYPLDDDGSGVAATGDITPTGSPTRTESYIIRVNNIDSKSFVVSVGDSLADITAAMVTAISSVLEMPITAVAAITPDRIDITSKWKGTSANDITLEVIGPTDAGVTFGITAMSGGLVNPDVDLALNQMGDIWETMVLNCMDVADTASLDKYSTFGEGRWGALTRKPLVVFTGDTNTTVASATAVPDARKTDRVNSQLVSPGSNDLPSSVAARQLARIVRLANENPAHDYGSQKATGLVPGADSDQWNYQDRDDAVKKGSSTIEVKDGVVNVSDTVTFYHPDGDPTPAYRFVVDIVKLQNIIFNIDLRFATDEWDGAPLLPDDQATSNRTAKKPKTAKAEAADIITLLGNEALISDPDTAKKNTLAEIDSGNPKRLNLSIPVQLSGNTNIISVDLDFGFFFGTVTTL